MLHYELVDPLEHLALLAASMRMGRARIGSCRKRRVMGTLKLHRRRLLVVAREQQRVVGFKLGYCERPGVFYSWLGAVDAEFEGQGIGRRLMELQHGWLEQRGYRLVRTATRNRFKRMLILNLLNGFELVGVRSKDGDAHLQLEKKLSPVVNSPESSPEPA